MSAWRLHPRTPVGSWVQDIGTGSIIGYVRRHTVTPGEQVIGIRRPRGGEWTGVPTWLGGVPAVFEPNQDTAAEALHQAWVADPDTNAPEVPDQ